MITSPTHLYERTRKFLHVHLESAKVSPTVTSALELHHLRGDDSAVPVKAFDVIEGEDLDALAREIIEACQYEAHMFGSAQRYFLYSLMGGCLRARCALFLDVEASTPLAGHPALIARPDLSFAIQQMAQNQRLVDTLIQQSRLGAETYENIIQSQNAHIERRERLAIKREDKELAMRELVEEAKSKDVEREIAVSDAVHRQALEEQALVNKEQRIAKIIELAPSLLILAMQRLGAPPSSILSVVQQLQGGQALGETAAPTSLETTGETQAASPPQADGSAAPPSPGLPADLVHLLGHLQALKPSAPTQAPAMSPPPAPLGALFEQLQALAATISPTQLDALSALLTEEQRQGMTAALMPQALPQPPMPAMGAPKQAPQGAAL